MQREPIFDGVGIDFTGTEYDIEVLPPVEQCDEGDTCHICWPGGSDWYQTWYRVEGGQWVEKDSTAPWQMKA